MSVAGTVQPPVSAARIVIQQSARASADMS